MRRSLPAEVGVSISHKKASWDRNKSTFLLYCRSWLPAVLVCLSSSKWVPSVQLEVKHSEKRVGPLS